MKYRPAKAGLCHEGGTKVGGLKPIAGCPGHAGVPVQVCSTMECVPFEYLRINNRPMQTITLRIDSSIYDRLMSMLGTFGKDELEVVATDDRFEADRRYLAAELEEIRQGKAKFYTIEEAEERLEALYRKHEARS